MPAFFHFNALEAPITWEIGESLCRQPRFRGCTITQVRANGRELDHIRYHMRGIRDVRNAQSVTWFGEDAQFIYSNLLDNVQ